jgi:hypothetical protein
MRRILKVVTVSAGVLLMAGSALAASGFEVGARGAYWFPKLTGGAQTNAIGDTRFDFKDDTLASFKLSGPYLGAQLSF